MSFLNIKIPVESLDHVLEVIREQIKADRLEVNSATSVEAIGRPTIEMRRLRDIVQREFKIDEKVELIPALVRFKHPETFYVWELIAKGGTCFIICLEEYEEGGAMWTDRTRKCTLNRKTILKCEEGRVEAKTKGSGGIYLLLIDKPGDELTYE